MRITVEVFHWLLSDVNSSACVNASCESQKHQTAFVSQCFFPPSQIFPCILHPASGRQIMLHSSANRKYQFWLFDAWHSHLIHMLHFIFSLFSPISPATYWGKKNLFFFSCREGNVKNESESNGTLFMEPSLSLPCACITHSAAIS